MKTTAVITQWSAYSPYGAGREAFAEGLAARRSAVAPIGSGWDTADGHAALVPGFDVRGVLGRKGTRGMNRISGLAVATVGLLQKDDAATGPHRALVLGTTTGSAETKMDTVRGALRSGRPYLIDPAAAPYVVMNGAAGQCAIWHGLKGPNATIAAGRPSGLAALGYARRLLLTGRATAVIAGAAEEYSRARSWLERRAAADDCAPPPFVDPPLAELPPPSPPLGEGCVMFAVSAGPPDGRPVLAELLAVDFRMCLDADWWTAVDRSVLRALVSAGRAAGDIWAVSASDATGQAGKAETAVLEQTARGAVALPALPGLVGETNAASSAFQIAAVLSEAARSADAAGRVAVITSTDPPTGVVATSVLGFRARSA
jgi:3-oxoacyl-[acyl-carrier-protein] synthase II